MLTYVQWRIELVTILLYTQVVITFFAIQTLFRLYSGSIKALLRLYSGSIKALLRLIQHTGARRLFRQHDAHPVAVAQRGNRALIEP